MKRITSFEDQVPPSQLRVMTKEAFDTLPFGTIKLDRQGVILVYNRWEATLARRKQEKVIGKNFFRDVAPCTDVAEFRGRLDQMVRDGLSTQTFDFDFKFPWGKRAVRVRFMVASADERWVFVTDLS